MNTQIIKNRLRKILAYTVTGSIFFLLTSFLLLQSPPVQEFLVNRYLGEFNQIIGFKTRIQTFRLLWFDRLELENVVIEDLEHNEMIAVNRLRINFKLFQLSNGKNILIDGLSIKGAHVSLKNIAESDTSQNLNINVFIDRINERYGGSGGGGAAPVVNIGEVTLANSQFSYDDGATDTLRGFDYHRFSLDIDESALEKLVIVGDTVEFTVQQLLARDKKTGLDIKELSSFFRISQTGMEFLNLKANVGNSHLSDTIVFSFKSQRDLSNFNEAVDIDAVLKDCYIHPNDLQLFAPDARKLTEPFILSGTLHGRINKFQLKHMHLGIGQSEINGKLRMEGLPYLDETFIEANLTNTHLDFNDLGFVLENVVLERLRPLGDVKLHGQFIGYLNDFVANGTFHSSLGILASDINLKINSENTDLSTYSGSLSLTDFDLGRYLKDTATFQRINLKGNVVGSGLSARSADLVLKSSIKSIGVLNYNYSNISTNARLSDELFSGTVGIDDPNLQAKVTGSVDLRKNKNIIKIHGAVDTASLHALKLTKDELFFSTGIDINSEGFVLDSLIGNGTINEVFVGYKGKKIHLPYLELTSKRNKLARELNLKSNLIDAGVKGSFYFSELFKDLQSLLIELNLSIVNDSVKTQEYYNSLVRKPADYNATFQVNLKNTKPITDLFGLDLTLDKNVQVEGSFTNGLATKLFAFTNIPNLKYQDFTFKNTTIEVNTSKLVHDNSILAMVSLHSDNQEIKNISTKDLLTEIIWHKSHIDFSVDLDQKTMDNNIRLRGGVDFKDSTYIHLKNSSFRLFDKVWQINDNTFISQRGKEWHLQHVGFNEGDQRINVHGNISEDETLPLQITLRNLQLQDFESLTTEKFNGLVQADVVLKNMYHNLTVENEIDVSDLTINDFLVGNLTGFNKWSSEENKFLIDFLLNRQGIKAINLDGYYDPANEQNPLNVTAKLNQASLRLAEPVLRGLFSQIDGTVTGDFTIKGTIKRPLIRGTGSVVNGQIMIDYLKTLYKFNGTIGMTPSTMYFENIILSDIYNNTGKIEGFIAHKNFNSMRVNIDGNFNNFMVLNTAAPDNELFYGQAFASGKVNFFGPVSNLKISATARTEKNTKLFIPINGTSSVEKKEFISYVSFADTTKNKTKGDANKKALTGLTIDLNLDITEDAYCEIIFDLKAGDIIRGRGNGDLRLQLDTKGEFNMFGGLTFEQGGYNFTLYNLINKEFEIQKGGKITWSGDPYEAQLSIHAAYNQLASLAPIVTNTAAQKETAVRRKYPLQVLMKLQGTMLSPEITFDIVAKDLPQNITASDGSSIRLAFEFAAFKAKLDEQELMKQVFSLIILRRLSPLNETISTSGSVTNSVSELLSNQLSYWVSQMDENLEIDLDLGAMDQDAFNTFQLRLSYTFLNGRLRITRDGTFASQNNASNTTGGAANNGSSSLVGDWTVDYLLTNDGKFKVRMYNRTNVNPIITSLNSQNTFTTGVSLHHTQTFNTLRDLWRSSRSKKEKAEKEHSNNTEAILKEEEGAND